MDKNELLDCIRKAVREESLCTLRPRAGCRVYMTDVPSPRVVVDVDLAFPAHERKGQQCDYILFFFDAVQNLVVVPMELKRGSIDLSEAEGQLQGGADFAASLVPMTKDLRTICRPLLFHGGRVHLGKQKKRRKNRHKAVTVRFQGKVFEIKTAHCGETRNLAKALSREIRS